MPSLAKSPFAPVLGQRVPLRGPARLLHRSYARTRYQPRKSVVRVTTGAGDVFDADLSSKLEWHLWTFGSWEPHFGELFRYLLRPGDQCVDVGANIGVHAVRMGRLVGPDGAVIAIEADPDMARRAERNIGLNDLGNVTVINAAASERSGEMRLYRPAPNDTNRGRSSLHGHAYLTGPAITVPVLTVDEACGGAPVTLIKIDVEGHEAAVVRGAAGTITAHAPAVIFEYAPELLDDPVAQSPFGWLAECGYVMFRIRAARHGITGRTRLALDRMTRLSPTAHDLLAIPERDVPRLGPLLG